MNSIRINRGLNMECGVAQIVARAGLLYGRPGFESRLGTLYRAESNEDNKSGAL